MSAQDVSHISLLVRPQDFHFTASSHTSFQLLYNIKKTVLVKTHSSPTAGSRLPFTMSDSGMLEQTEPSSNWTSWHLWFLIRSTRPLNTLLNNTQNKSFIHFTRRKSHPHTHTHTHTQRLASLGGV